MVDFEQRIIELRDHYKNLYNTCEIETEKDIYFDVIGSLNKLLAEVEAQRHQESGICICGKAFEQNQGRGRKGKYCSDACKQKAIRDKKNRTKRRSLGRPIQASLFLWFRN